MSSNSQGSSQPPRRRYPRRGSVTEHTLRAQRQVIRDLSSNSTQIIQSDNRHHHMNATHAPMGFATANHNLSNEGDDGLIVDFPTSRSIQPDSYREDPSLTQASAGYSTSNSDYTGTMENHQNYYHQDDIMMDPDQQLTGWNPNYGDSAMGAPGRRDSVCSSMYSAGRRDSVGSSAYSFNAGGAGAGNTATRRDSMESTLAAYSDR
mmetsp:Transcript_7787/g.11177  ORF Transcript_7787/g.11177 Transcript_7787/m.11177 type:complete len:206 (-) Transcript_7787:82-699(-)